MSCGDWPHPYLSLLDCVAFDHVAENTSEYCNKGDIVGVKGRVQSRIIEEGDNKKQVMEIICEKITFLSSKPKEEKEAE